jgi:flagellar biosynthesis protein FlhG
VNTRLGDFLLERGIVSETQLGEALEKQKDVLKPLGEVLIDLGILDESGLARALSEQLNIPYVDLLTVPFQPKAIDAVPEHMARKYKCIPTEIKSGLLNVAMHDPMDLDALEEIARVSQLQVNPMISTRCEILESIELHYYTRNYRFSHVQKLESDIRAEVRAEDSPGKEPRIFAVISNKGGVGKTHTSVNLACAFAEMKQRTLLIDIDLGNANVGVKIGVHPKHTLMDLLNKERDIFEIVTETEYGFDLIAGESGEYRLANLAYVQKLKFVRNFREVSKNYDVVIFDLSAGIDSTVLDFALAANEVIIVTTPQDIVAGYACLKAGFFRFKKLEAMLEKKLKDYEPKDSFAPKFVVNQVETREMGQRVFDKIKATAAKHFGGDGSPSLDVGFLGFIPYDRDTFRKAEKQRRPYLFTYPNRSASKCFRGIAAELMKPAALREPVVSHVKPGNGSAPRPKHKPAPSSNHKGGFRRFVEIMKAKT